MGSEWMTEMSEQENDILGQALGAQFAPEMPGTGHAEDVAEEPQAEPQAEPAEPAQAGSIMDGMNSQGKYNALLRLLLSTSGMTEEDTAIDGFDMKAMDSKSSAEYGNMVNCLLVLSKYMDDKGITDESEDAKNLSLKSLVKGLRLSAIAYMEKNSGKRRSQSGKLRKAVAHKIVMNTELSLRKMAKPDDRGDIIEKSKERKQLLANDSKLSRLVKDASTDEPVSEQPVIQTFVKYPGDITKQHSFIGLRYTDVTPGTDRPFTRKEIRVGFGAGWKFPVAPVRIMNDFYTAVDSSTSTKVTNDKLNMALRVIQSKEGEVYRLFTHNCNHFVKEITDELGIQALREIHTAVFPGGALEKMKLFGKDAEKKGGVESVMDASGHIIDIKPTAEAHDSEDEDFRALPQAERDDRIAQYDDTKDVPVELLSQTQIGWGRGELEAFSSAKISQRTPDNSQKLNEYIGRAGAITSGEYRKLLMRIIGFDAFRTDSTITFSGLMNELVTKVRTTIGASGRTSDDAFYSFMKLFKFSRRGLSNFSLARMLTSMLTTSIEVSNMISRNSGGGKDEQHGQTNMALYAKMMTMDQRDTVEDEKQPGTRKIGAVTNANLTNTEELLARYRRVNDELHSNDEGLHTELNEAINQRIALVSLFEEYLNSLDTIR